MKTIKIDLDHSEDESNNKNNLHLTNKDYIYY